MYFCLEISLPDNAQEDAMAFCGISPKSSRTFAIYWEWRMAVSDCYSNSSGSQDI